jgi:hypothetical protein
MTETREKEIRNLIAHAYGNRLQPIAEEILSELDQLKQVILSMRRAPRHSESNRAAELPHNPDQHA